MPNEYPNSGSLNPTKDKRSERSPDWWGRLEISGDVLEALNQGKPVRLSGWEREGKYGEFISLAVSVEKPREESASDAGDQKSWPASGPQSRTTTRAKPGTIEGNLVRNAQSDDVPFDDSLPF